MDTAPKKISDLKTIVVDDHVIERTNIRRLLHALGCKHVDEAASVDLATEKMSKTFYDVVFLDWNMPGKTGIELLRKCRDNRSYDDTAFVMISAESGERHIIDALRAGATSYIVKPASEDKMREHLVEVVKWLFLQQELRR